MSSSLWPCNLHRSRSLFLVSVRVTAMTGSPEDLFSNQQGLRVLSSQAYTRPLPRFQTCLEVSTTLL